MPDQKNPKKRALKAIAKPDNKQVTKKKQIHLLWLGLGLTGVAMISATAGALLAVSLASTPLMQQKLSAEEEAVFGKGDSFSRSNMKLPEVTRPVNILVLGIKVITSDLNNPPSRTKNLGYHALVNSFDGLADTMLLLRFDPQKKKISVLSIPRDTQVTIDGYGVQKINAANDIGGPAVAAKEVSNLLEGVAIDRYIRINVQGVEKLIEALGGVTVYVPKDMKYQDDSQHLYINLKQGKQHLNGDQALQLLRFRYDQNGDIGRIQRQQMVLRALMEQALNPTILTRIPKILAIIQSHLDTNLSVEELAALVGFGIKTDRKQVQMLMLPGETNGNGHHRISYWLPNRSRIKTLMARYFDQGSSDRELVDTGKVRVTIQDSTGDSQAVKSLVRTLEEAGYRRITIDKSLPESLSVTQIIAQQGDDDSAKQVYSSLGFGDVSVETSGTLYSDVTIKLGLDWLQKQAATN
ncbi:MAG TPA: LCP family protein [Candidatus Sericytochromatia bacterium]